MATARRKFSEYRKEAKPEPFVLVDDNGEDIVLEPPDTEKMMDLAEIPSTQPRRILSQLCGEQFDRVWELVRHEPISTLNELVTDITDHFGMGNAQDVPGGSRASSR